MPLTFNFEAIDGYNVDGIGNTVGYTKIDEDSYTMDPKSDAMIWHTLNTGIGTITPLNAAEVYARIALVEELYGPSLRMPDEKDGGKLKPYYLTIDDVRAHIGLVTNASFKDESRASYLKRHASFFLEQRKNDFRLAVIEEAVA